MEATLDEIDATIHAHPTLGETIAEAALARAWYGTAHLGDRWNVGTDAGYVIDFEPIGRRVEAAEQETLLQAAQRAGLAWLLCAGGGGRVGAAWCR